MLKNILVPVDGSDHSRKALELACELGKKQGATLHLLHIVQAPTGKRVLTLGSAAVTIDADSQQLQKAGKQVVGSAEDIARGHGFEKVAVSVAGGDPAARIIDYAKDKNIDMIVMGSRGLSDLTGLLMGSVSHKVSHLAHCSCVTVR